MHYELLTNTNHRRQYPLWTCLTWVECFSGWAGRSLHLTQGCNKALHPTECEEEVVLNLSPPGILLFLVECPLLSPARLLSLLLQLLPRFRWTYALPSVSWLRQSQAMDAVASNMGLDSARLGSSAPSLNLPTATMGQMSLSMVNPQIAAMNTYPGSSQLRKCGLPRDAEGRPIKAMWV